MSDRSSRASAISSGLVLLIVVIGFAITATGLRELVFAQNSGTAWRWGGLYLEMFVGIGLFTGVLGLWRGPLIGMLIAGLLIIAAGNALLPLVAVAAMAISAYLLGRLVFRNGNVAVTDYLLVGVTLFGTLLSLMVYLPINYPGVWAVLFALPILAEWRLLRVLPSFLGRAEAVEAPVYILQCAIGAALLLHLMASLMPEIGHDALAMHLFVPSQVAYRHLWNFDVKLYVWAVMPMLVDWCYSAAYMFAGETAARLVNFGGIVLLSAMVHRFARWMGAGPVGAAWAVLLFLVTPLTFTESSSLFVEGLWSALVLGGILALLRLFTEASQDSSRQIMLGGVLWAGALAAKTVTFTVLPGMALILIVGAPRWLSFSQLRTLSLGLVTFLIIGCVPYAGAFLLTGNPVFPFFNALFQSPLYPAVNFGRSAVFEYGVAWNTLYRMTFESQKFLESTPGAGGFHWLLLLIPAVVSLLLARNLRAMSVLFVASLALVLAFGQTAYLRYVFPSFALSCAIIAPVLTSLSVVSVLAWRTGILAAIAATILDLLHLNAGTYYGDVNLRVITDMRARDTYIENVSPLRAAVELVNGLNRQHEPVAFFSSPLIAGLKGDVLTNSWYNGTFAAAVQNTRSADELGQILARHGVDYVVIDQSEVSPDLLLRVNQATTEAALIGTVSVRRLSHDYRFTEELLLSPTFDVASAWSMTQGVRQLEGKALLVSVDETAHSGVQVQPGKLYRYSAEVRCAETPGAEARLQVNWMSADGRFIYPDIHVFSCSAQTEKHVMDVRAPANAATAIVYASGHTKQAVIFSSISFRD